MTRKSALLVILGMLFVERIWCQNPAVRPDDLYDTCAATIRTNPGEAYAPCRQYLEQAPVYETTRIQNVNEWMANYQKVEPYVEFLKGLNNDPNARWSVYLPDMNVDLPETSEMEGNFKIHIARSFADANGEAMLRKAEAVYDSPANMITNVLRNVRYWAANPPKEMVPIWGHTGNDDIEMANIVTARAVRYFYDLSRRERSDPRLPTGFAAVQSIMKYDASIKHADHYVHSKDAFDNVYVADMNLEWSFTCGGLCGVGFTRNKIVILDARGNVVALYLDAPVNSQFWVS